MLLTTSSHNTKKVKGSNPQGKNTMCIIRVVPIYSFSLIVTKENSTALESFFSFPSTALCTI